MRQGRNGGPFVALLAVGLLLLQGQYAVAATPRTGATASASAPAFSAPLILARQQNQIQTLTTGDVNGDGLPDIVAADSGGHVAVILDEGDARFADPVSYDVGGSIHSVLLSDVNHDGHPDIVATDDRSGSGGGGAVAVLLNKGNGTFAAPVFYDVPGQPWGLAIGDVTGDGVPDVVTTDYGKAEISVLAGRSDGTLAPAANYPDGLDASDYPDPQGVALGDFRNNGRLDAVIADGGTGSAGGTYVSYLSNDGHGVFGNPATTQVANTYQDPAQILAGDFNRDGKLDYAVVIDGCGYGAGDVLIYLGNGSGSFTPGQDTHDGCMAGSALADVNGDHIPDIVSAVGDSFEDSNAFGRVAMGNGDGTFATPVNYPIAPAQSASAVAVGDFTGGGRPDLVVGSGDGDITVLFNESGSGPSYLAGTVRQSGQPVSGSVVEACTGTGPARCVKAPGASDLGGDFAMAVRDATYAVSAEPPPGTTGMAPTTIGPVTIGERVTVVGLDFDDRLPPPGSTFDTPSHGSQQNTVPIVNWGEPSTYTTTGCKGGAGVLQVDATNTATGQPDARFFAMTEDPSGSGTYVAHLPALAPLHGDSLAEQHIACAPHTKIFPNGGSSDGGTDVMLTGSGFTGATAVTFGGAAARSFRVLSDSLAIAVSPAGTGNVPVTVTGPHGQQGLGTFGYISVTSLSVTSGPAAGGTFVDIHGTGFTNVGGVIFGVLPATGVQTVSATEVTAYAPPGVGTVQVQVVNGDSASPAGSGTTFTYTGGPPGSGSLVEGSGGVVSSTTTATRDRLAARDDDSGSGSYGDQLDADCQQGEADAQYVDIGQGELCRGIHEIINDFGPLGAAQNVGITSAIVGGGFFVAALAAVAPEVVIPTLVFATLVGFAWGLFTDWNFLTDPSGTVVSTKGNPVANATATLQVYDPTVQEFRTMPASSGDIDPATNPETTGNTGAFDWDAVAGTYRVTASAHSCTSPDNPGASTVATAPFPIPPPVTGLLLTLKCPNQSSPKPAVSAVSPPEGSARGGQVVQIDGSGLANVTAVHFGPATATDVHVLSPYAIQVTTPAGKGTPDVRVRGPGGTSAETTADHYVYLPAPPSSSAPRVTGLSPRTGPVAGGTRMTITGRNFTNPVSVDVGGVAATSVVRVSDSTIAATVPAATFSGATSVTVTAGGETSPAGAAATFDYLSPSTAANPAVSKLSVRPFVSRSGAIGVGASWRLPSGSETAVACLGSRTATARRCPDRHLASRRISFGRLRIGHTYVLTVFAKGAGGRLSAPTHRRLDGTRILARAVSDGRGLRLVARVSDERTHRWMTHGTLQLWQRVGSRTWRRVASVPIRGGRATTRVRGVRHDDEWRYGGAANRRMAATSAA